MATNVNSTTLEQHLASALADLLAADAQADCLDDDTSWDVGLELLSARAAIQKARDILDRLPAFDRMDAEPRSAGTVHSYA
jgi:hypothetical protein